MVEMTEAEQRELVDAIDDLLDIDVSAETSSVDWSDTHMVVTINDIALPDPSLMNDEFALSVNMAVERIVRNAIADTPLFAKQHPTVSAELWSPEQELYR